MKTTGVLSMPAEQYRAAEGISKHMLDWMAPPKTPAHFRARFITGEIEDEETPARRLGSLTHRCILEPDTLESAFYVRPADLKFTTKEGIAWKEAHQDRPILAASEAQAMVKMRDAVWRHSLAKRLLLGAIPEQALFAEDSEGTLRKARLDALTAGNIIPDLKTCDSASPDEIGRAVVKYRYDVQAAYYIDICRLVGIEKTAFVLICVEKTPPYAVTCLRIDPLDEEWGRRCYRRDLALYRDCLANDRWPGFGDEFGIATIPGWAKKEREQAEAA